MLHLDTAGRPGRAHSPWAVAARRGLAGASPLGGGHPRCADRRPADRRAGPGVRRRARGAGGAPACPAGCPGLPAPAGAGAARHRGGRRSDGGLGDRRGPRRWCDRGARPLLRDGARRRALRVVGPVWAGVGYVLFQHRILGTLDSEAVYNHASAQQHPWAWAGIHATLFAATRGRCPWRAVAAAPAAAGGFGPPRTSACPPSRTATGTSPA